MRGTRQGARDASGCVEWTRGGPVGALVTQGTEHTHGPTGARLATRSRTGGSGASLGARGTPGGRSGRPGGGGGADPAAHRPTKDESREGGTLQ